MGSCLLWAEGERALLGEGRAPWEIQVAQLSVITLGRVSGSLSWRPGGPRILPRDILGIPPTPARASGAHYSGKSFSSRPMPSPKRQEDFRWFLGLPWPDTAQPENIISGSLLPSLLFGPEEKPRSGLVSLYHPADTCKSKSGEDMESSGT